MSDERKVLCDNCGADLTFTGNSVDYSLRLVNRSIPTKGGWVTDMGVCPCIKENLDFCGTGCLKKYIGEGKI